MFFCGAVVCFCGLEFVVEVAEMFCFVVGCYCGGPFFQDLVPGDAFVFRDALDLGSVPLVLGLGCEAKVCFSVVEAVMVYVVDEEVGGGVEDLAVHFYDAGFYVVGSAGLALGVTCSGAAAEVPFVFVQVFVIFGVDYREFALGEGDSSECAVVSKSAIGEQDG